MKMIQDKAFFDEAFAISDKHVPAKLRTAVEKIVRAYDIQGICDPMWIANVIACELRLGDGLSHFNAEV